MTSTTANAAVAQPVEGMDSASYRSSSSSGSQNLFRRLGSSAVKKVRRRSGNRSRANSSSQSVGDNDNYSVGSTTSSLASGASSQMTSPGRNNSTQKKKGGSLLQRLSRRKRNNNSNNHATAEDQQDVVVEATAQVDLDSYFEKVANGTVMMSDGDASSSGAAPVEATNSNATTTTKASHNLASVTEEQKSMVVVSPVSVMTPFLTEPVPTEETTNAAPSSVSLEPPSLETNREPAAEAVPAFSNGSIHRHSLYLPGDVDKILQAEQAAMPVAEPLEPEPTNLHGPPLPHRHYFYINPEAPSQGPTKESQPKEEDSIPKEPVPVVVTDIPAPWIAEETAVADLWQLDHHNENDIDDETFLNVKLNILDKHLQHDDESDLFLQEKLQLFDTLYQGQDEALLPLEAPVEDNDDDGWMLHAALSTVQEDDNDDDDNEINDYLETKLTLFEELHQHDDPVDVYLDRQLNLLDQYDTMPDAPEPEDPVAVAQRKKQETQQILLQDMVGMFVV
uniref:Uncharacterized protein n=1 Tax=Entomoneis paludosa TaxID=265537 RepID=A0A7S2V8R0_9STRA|eukprot:CAMPEP_0172468230 /NCGR_PEP_ID=MMETSP1065-20121228/60868_1 /TAXON_ID=265537 /ORGANISM="Amphiprora paludosa, Strain CCMP125" /LENGTH=506 /DNA_ID=CAMNT_0013225583 /DNA_START=221 /DNA_END=1741 /DNA_ORIENTATION=-